MYFLQTYKIPTKWPQLIITSALNHELPTKKTINHIFSSQFKGVCVSNSALYSYFWLQYKTTSPTSILRFLFERLTESFRSVSVNNASSRALVRLCANFPLFRLVRLLHWLDLPCWQQILLPTNSQQAIVEWKPNWLRSNRRWSSRSRPLGKETNLL